MQNIREFICYNQKKLMQYEFEIADIHKKFKQNKTEQNLEQLIVDGFDMLLNIFRDNLTYINNSFGIDDLRVTIKMVDDTKAIDIFRSNYNIPFFKSINIEENKGFSDIVIDKQLCYLNEDLEQSFLEGVYFNPRIDKSKKDRLRSGEISWQDCWVYDNDKDYYNSTLIIPMSISSSGIDPTSKFYKRFFEKNTTSIKKIQTDEHIRTIFGFFCLDSKEKFSFTNNLGIEDSLHLGFIFADILSLYLAFYYDHTSGSESVEEFLKGSL